MRNRGKPMSIRSDKLYFATIAIIFVLCVVALTLAPQPVDWSSSFSRKDKIPYGTFVLFDILKYIFPENEVREVNTPIYNALDDSSQWTNLIIINEDFQPDELDTEQLLATVRGGSNAFIAAQSFGKPFSDSLGITTSMGMSGNSLNFANTTLRSDTAYTLSRGVLDFYFSSFDTLQATVLGWTSGILSDQLVDQGSEQANFMRIRYGKGQFYVHSIPLAFTNYALLQGGHLEYVLKAFSYLPEGTIIWDEYYKVRRHSAAATPLRFVLSNQSLKWAYYVIMTGILVFILVNGKRRQRAIPIVRPPQNTTLEFITTIGRLFLRNADNKTIADKKIALFLEQIRTRFKLRTRDLSAGFVEQLSQRAEKPKEQIEELVDRLKAVQRLEQVSATELAELNQSIEAFHQG